MTLSASASETDKPTVWIEVGGQLERLTGREDAFLPPFTLQSPTPAPFSPISPSEAQKPSIYTYGFEGEVSVQPHGSDWSIAAAVRYGRSSNSKHIHQQSVVTSQYPNPKYPAFQSNPTATATEPVFADFKVKNRESHSIIDFQVGRDVGVGIFSSIARVGLRMANFSSKSQTGIIARPDASFYPRRQGRFIFRGAIHTDYMASSYNERSFRGIGPAVSWKGEVPVIGGESGAITLDWEANAAVLFGRQKAKGLHHTSARYYKGARSGTPPPGVSLLYDNPPRTHNRFRSVAVPNVGFLAGFSFRYPNAKVSFGYRADMFFGAMDMGIDQSNTKDRVFHGPFATISVGLGE
jgi:hypothetical protein